MRHDPHTSGTSPRARRRLRPRVRRRSRSRIGPVLVALAFVVGVIVIRSPVALFALAEPFRPASTGEGPSAGASVEDDVAVESDGASDGRWGASPIRPGDGGLLLEEIRGGWRIEAGGEEAAALAVIAAHDWADARTTATDRSSGEVVVVVEAVERPGTLHAVVTLLVRMTDELHRLAFPVTFGVDGPMIAGAPWPLPAPVAVPLPLAGVPVDDAELVAAARRALETVGIGGDRLVAVEATDGWPFIARLDDDTVGHPWLRWHLDRFVVSGLPLHRSGEFTRATTLRGVEP
jgi:hypothetical protein